MIKKELLLTLFDTNSIQRWNDKLRPIDLVELDYQGHRMMIAYLMGKFEEQNHGINWVDIIEGGIFDLLETAVLTDLKWDVKDRLNKRKVRREKKNQYVLGQLNPLLEAVSHGLLERFQNYLAHGGTRSLAEKTLKAASTFARWWEFQILWPANPSGYEMDRIKGGLEKDKEKYNYLTGCRQVNCYGAYRDFIELCSQLRFQARWSYLHMVPRSSVLGHSMFVAVVSYLFSLETDACDKLKINNFFSGLFHDLEETQIRDVRSPLKRELPELGDTLQEMSSEMMERKVLPLLPSEWWDEFRQFSMEGLESDFATIDGQRKEIKEKDDIYRKYNDEKFHPRSGSLVKAADKLAAFIEAYRAVENGCGNEALWDVIKPKTPNEYEGVEIGSVKLGDIYKQFKIRDICRVQERSRRVGATHHTMT